MGVLIFTQQGEKVILRVEGVPYAHFTATESAILNALAIAVERVLSRDYLYSTLYWDRAGEGPEPKILDVMLLKIRRKLINYNLPFEVHTIWGRGWQLKAKDVV